MRTLNQIKQEIDILSDRRIEVMRALSQGFDATLKAEHQGQLGLRVETLGARP